MAKSSFKLVSLVYLTEITHHSCRQYKHHVLSILDYVNNQELVGIPNLLAMARFTALTTVLIKTVVLDCQWVCWGRRLDQPWFVLAAIMVTALCLLQRLGKGFHTCIQQVCVLPLHRSISTVPVVVRVWDRLWGVRLLGLQFVLKLPQSDGRQHGHFILEGHQLHAKCVCPCISHLDSRTELKSSETCQKSECSHSVLLVVFKRICSRKAQASLSVLKIALATSGLTVSTVK